jgi:ketosteroid isomerase-like protein
VTTEANKQLVRDYADAFNRGDLDRLKEIFSADAVIQGVLGWGGLDVVVPIWEELHAAFGVELIIEDLVAEGDTVAARYTERGRFVAPFRGAEPTGKTTRHAAEVIRRSRCRPAQAHRGSVRADRS